MRAVQRVEAYIQQCGLEKSLIVNQHRTGTPLQRRLPP